MHLLRSVLAGGLIALLTVAAPAATAAPSGASTTIKAAEKSGKYIFSPTQKTIKVGTTVRWTNPTDAPHTITSKTKTWKMDKQLNHGKTVQFTFKHAGTYLYHCTFHPGMNGEIIVKM
jgi:plastocyanin